ncbi:MAG: GNAT family N-acetyltransferase [Granulosicoccus sp.]|nr:GNAT family N-acetyltransferase [Granulosicoccus sp.]
MSWTWIAQLHERRQDAVCVLAYRPSAASAEHVAYLPLRKRIEYNRKSGKFVNTLCMAGNDWADHTGVLCLPGYQDTALPLLGHYLAGMQPARVQLHNLHMRKSDVMLLKACFENSRYKVKRDRLADNGGETSLDTSPRLELDSSFTVWLREKTSAGTRQKIRRFRRQLENSPDSLIRQSDQQSMDADLDEMQRLWEERWSTMKGRQVGAMGAKYRRIVADGMRSGQMFVLVMQRKEKPVAIHAYYSDPVRKSILFYVGARDVKQKSGSPGLLLHAQAIEGAIQRGFRWIDFLRGDEKYKYSLGASDVPLYSYSITDQQLPGAARLLDDQCLQQVLDLLAHHQSRRSEKTMEGLYSQALDTWPANTALLTQYAQWQRSIGHSDLAATILSSIQ